MSVPSSPKLFLHFQGVSGFLVGMRDLGEAQGFTELLLYFILPVLLKVSGVSPQVSPCQLLPTLTFLSGILLVLLLVVKSRDAFQINFLPALFSPLQK